MQADKRHGDSAKDQRYITDLVSIYYDELKARFGTLPPSEQNFYIDYINSLFDNLGSTFAGPDKEEFEYTMTDIMNFDDVVKGLVAIGLLQITGDKRYEGSVPDAMQPTKAISVAHSGFDPQDNQINM